jgi:hypothetical protein
MLLQTVMEESELPTATNAFRSPLFQPILVILIPLPWGLSSTGLR